jgi:hypothetical protein
MTVQRERKDSPPSISLRTLNSPSISLRALNSPSISLRAQSSPSISLRAHSPQPSCLRAPSPQPFGLRTLSPHPFSLRALQHRSVSLRANRRWPLCLPFSPKRQLSSRRHHHLCLPSRVNALGLPGLHLQIKGQPSKHQPKQHRWRK